MLLAPAASSTSRQRSSTNGPKRSCAPAGSCSLRWILAISARRVEASRQRLPGLLVGDLARCRLRSAETMARLLETRCCSSRNSTSRCSASAALFARSASSSSSVRRMTWMIAMATTADGEKRAEGRAPSRSVIVNEQAGGRKKYQPASVEATADCDRRPQAGKIGDQDDRRDEGREGDAGRHSARRTRSGPRARRETRQAQIPRRRANCSRSGIGRGRPSSSPLAL